MEDIEFAHKIRNIKLLIYSSTFQNNGLKNETEIKYTAKAYHLHGLIKVAYSFS